MSFAREKVNNGFRTFRHGLHGSSQHNIRSRYSIIDVGHSLGFYTFGVRKGGASYTPVAMQGFSSQAWTLRSAQGGYLTFSTTPNGSATRTERLRIDQGGNVGIGTTTPTQKLEVNGSALISTIYGSSASSGVLSLQSTSHTTKGVILIGFDHNTTTRIGQSGTSEDKFLAADRLIVNNAGVRINGAPDYSNLSVTKINITNPDALQFRSSTPNIQSNGSLLFTVQNLGGDNVKFNIAPKYQDVAEWVESSQELAAGTVVLLDPTKSNQVIASTQGYDSSVAGVISLKPGITLRERGERHVLVATTGRVKVKVDATNGPIQIGDLLVTSDKTGGDETSARECRRYTHASTRNVDWQGTRAARSRHRRDPGAAEPAIT